MNFVQIYEHDCRRSKLKGIFAKPCLDRLCLLTDVLGIIVIKEEEMLDSEIEEMIEKRQACKERS